jgi:ubiquinone/menaquinone biosynthesis C-methylase UbiE
MTGAADPARRYWERHARKYDTSLRLLGQPLPRMLELIGEAVLGAERVLEVAAGTGLVTIALARSAKEVVATDYAAAMVAALQAKVRHACLDNVEALQADLYRLPFDDHSFDAVVAANVLHLVPDLPGAMLALRRVLKPGGRLLVPTFCHDETRRSWATSRLLALTGFPGQRRFTAGTLRGELEAAGLSVSRSETISGLIPVVYVEGTFAAA